MGCKPKLGFIALAKKNHFRGEINELVEYYRGKLGKDAGIETDIVAEAMFDQDEIVATARRMENEGCDLIVFVVGTWVYSSIAIAAVNDLKVPFVLWGLSDRVANGNIGAAVQIRYVLSEMKKNFIFLSGATRDETIYENILQYLRAAWVRSQMRNKSIATIGGKCMMMYQTQVNEFNWKSVFGVDFPQYDTVQVFKEMENISEEDAKKVADEFLARFKEVHWELDTGEKIYEDAVVSQAKMYLAFKKLKEMYNIEVFANKCMPEMNNLNYGYGYAACLATCMLNEDGIMTACEADVPAGFSMYILHKLTGDKAFFADISGLRKSEQMINFFNCGTAPVSLADPDRDISLWPIPANISDEAVVEKDCVGKMKGACIHFDLYDNKTVTLLRVGGNDDTLRFHVIRATTTSRDVDPEDVLSTRWPGFALKLKGDIDECLENTTGHHYSLVYGDWVKELGYLAKILGVGFDVSE